MWTLNLNITKDMNLFDNILHPDPENERAYCSATHIYLIFVF